MARSVWLVELIKKAYPGRFLLAKTTNVPIIGRAIEHLLFRGDDLMYLPKTRTIQVNKPVDRSGEMVLPSQVVEHFIEKANYHWIMDFCICRDSMQCEDYPIDLGCLFLGEAVLGINPQLGRSVSREEALEHVQRCRDAGLVHMVGRNKLDSVWLGVSPSNRLLTICNCCPCCCLWRVLPHIAPRIGDKVTRMPGVTVTVKDLCVGCGACTEDVCFADAISLYNGRAVIGDACRGCGRCVEVCPEGAIELSLDGWDGVDEAIKRVSRLVDVT